MGWLLQAAVPADVPPMVPSLWRRRGQGGHHGSHRTISERFILLLAPGRRAGDRLWAKDPGPAQCGTVMSIGTAEQMGKPWSPGSGCPMAQGFPGGVLAGRVPRFWWAQSKCPARPSSVSGWAQLPPGRSVAVLFPEPRGQEPSALGTCAPTRLQLRPWFI